MDHPRQLLGPSEDSEFKPRGSAKRINYQPGPEKDEQPIKVDYTVHVIGSPETVTE